MDCHPIQTNSRTHLYISTIFTLDAFPDTTLPIYPGLGQAPNMLACIPGGLMFIKKMAVKIEKFCLYNASTELSLPILAVADTLVGW